jgi:AraC-like DNA-binding protein
MTVYEQVQNAIDFVEEHLCEYLSCNKVAEQANMSLRSFYNYFWAISGYRYGEYLRKRRLSEGLFLLKQTDDNIIHIAFRSGYESHEAFSRAFRAEFGLSLIRFRKSRQKLKGLKRIRVIEEMHMGIIIKDLLEIKVVSYIGFSPEPETKAHNRIWKWAKDHGYGDLNGSRSRRARIRLSSTE